MQATRTFTVLLSLLLPIASLAATEPEVPPREQNDYTHLPFADLWNLIEAQGQGVVVGLKRAAASRGLWMGRSLIHSDALTAAKSRLLAIQGVKEIDEMDLTPVDLDGNRWPIVRVTLESASALENVLSLPELDYIEPIYIRFFDNGISGCTGNELDGNPRGGELYDCATRPCVGLGNGWADIIPDNWRFHQIREGWELAPWKGDGIRIALLDTGVFEAQEQMFTDAQHPMTGRFDFSWQNRLAPHYAYNGFGTQFSDSGYDHCNHGTRMAGLIAAPQDNLSIVGIAPNAHLESHKISNKVTRSISYVLQNWAEEYVDATIAVSAIHNAAQSNRIVVMAWGGLPNIILNQVGDAIRQELVTNQHLLFVAAAGTTVPFVVYPASMPEVVAVTLVWPPHQPTSYPSERTDVAYGPEVEFAIAMDNDVPSLGRTQSDLLKMGGSSTAAAFVAGIAANIWSMDPYATAATIREKLRSSTGHGGKVSGRWGYGIPNLFAAFGGLAYVRLNVRTAPAPAQQVTASCDPAAATGPLSYSWFVNEQLDPSQTGSTYVFDSGKVGSTRTLRCEVLQPSTQAEADSGIPVRITTRLPKCTQAQFYNCAQHPQLCDGICSDYP